MLCGDGKEGEGRELAGEVGWEETGENYKLKEGRVGRGLHHVCAGSFSGVGGAWRGE